MKIGNGAGDAETVDLQAPVWRIRIRILNPSLASDGIAYVRPMTCSYISNVQYFVSYKSSGPLRNTHLAF